MNTLAHISSFLTQKFNAVGQNTWQHTHFPHLKSLRETILSSDSKTPYFLTDTSVIKEHFDSMKNALNEYWGKNAIIAYSHKTNYSVARLPALKKWGLWAEVVSGKEYESAKTYGYSGKTLIFNGPLKQDSEIISALGEGSIIHIDNKEEFFRINSFAQRNKKLLPIGIRMRGRSVNFQESRFGFSSNSEDIQEVLNNLKKNTYLRLQSVHVHSGSDIESIQTYKNTGSILADFSHRAEKVLGYPLLYLDAGGGYPANGLCPYSYDEWNPRTIDVYIRSLAESLIKKGVNRSYKQLIVEPGRYLVDDSTIFVIKVISVRFEQGKQHVITDGAITQIPLVYYRPQIMNVYTNELKEKNTGYIKSVVYGATCKEDDVLYRNYLPLINKGDILIFYCMGAYNQSMGSDFIFGKVPSIVV